jgi:hypothetical protein
MNCEECSHCRDDTISPQEKLLANQLRVITNYRDDMMTRLEVNRFHENNTKAFEHLKLHNSTEQNYRSVFWRTLWIKSLLPSTLSDFLTWIFL